MSYIKYIFLGIIQGITEPLPISSSAHIYILKTMLNINMFNDLNFEIFANFGSFIAIFIIYLKDIKHLFKGTIKKNKNTINYIIKLVISSIPVGITGLLFKDKIEAIISIKLISICLLLTSILLLIVKNKNGIKKDNDITIKDSIIIGLFQMIALVPGLSRSGMTLVGCLLCNLKKDTSLKYTFMLYFPVSLASFILSLNINTELLTTYLIGTLTSFIVTYLTFNWFKNLVQNNKLYKFSIYCLLLSLFILFYYR